MRNIGNIVAAAVTIMALPLAAFGDALTAPQKASVRAGIKNLVATVDMNSASEKPRLGKTNDGSLQFFGAPPNAPARLDDTLKAGTPEQKAKGFLQQHAAAFGIKSPAVAFDVKRLKTANNRTFVCLSQTYAGLPVFGGEIIVQLDSAGDVATVLSDITHCTDDLDKEANSLTPVTTRQQAEQTALEKAAETIILEGRRSAAISAMQDAYKAGTTDGSSLVAVAVDYLSKTADASGKQIISTSELQGIVGTLVASGGAELVVYDPEVVGAKGSLTLAWQVTVAQRSGVGWSERLLVDARSGQVVAEIPLVAQLLDRAIYDSQETEDYPGVLVRAEGDPPTSDPENPHTGGEEVEDADLVYEYFSDTYDFYYDHHNRDSIDGNGKTLRAEVRYCYKGQCLWSAGWDYDEEQGIDQLFIGVGGFAVDDCIAHEFTHGVTFHESGLLYLNESGAINESLSDVWGEFVDLTNGRGYDDEEVEYLIGEEIPDVTRLLSGTFLTGTWTPAPALRSMRAPSDYQTLIAEWPFIHVFPDRYNSPDFYRGDYDNGGVHINNCVNNKLCYLLAHGDTFNGRTVSGMGISLVADLYYECQTDLLPSGADYIALYYALGQAAVNLGLSQAQRENIDEACDAVEIRPTACVIIRGSDGEPVLRFTDAGDIVLRYGAILTEQTISPYPSVPEFIVRDSEGTNLALINSVTGDLYLKGKLYENVSQVFWGFPNDSLLIRNDGEPVAFVNSVDFFDYLVEPQFPWIVPAGSLIIEGHAVYLGF